MITESEFFEQIADAWPAGDEQPSQHLAQLVSQAVAQYPASSEMWVLYGDFLNISDADLNPDVTVENVMAAYAKALELDPACAEAHQEMGFLHDVYRDDFEAAEAAFRAAITFGAGVDSHCGLARAVAQQGRTAEALELLSPANCPFSDLPEVQEVRQEIEAGMWS